MKIISKFHDYYDTALAFGIDKTIIYNRIQSDEKNTTGLSLPHPENNYRNFWIGFCGKLYRGTRHTDENFNHSFCYGEFSDHFSKLLSRNKEYPKHGSEALDLFLKYKVPCFYLGQRPGYLGDMEFILNPELKKFDFFKVFPAFEANQEIQRFLTNELAQERDTPIKQTDKEKVKSHGFDKFSFRKEKQ